MVEKWNYKEIVNTPSLQKAVHEAVSHYTNVMHKSCHYQEIIAYCDIKYAGKWRDSYIERMARHLAQTDLIRSDGKGNFWLKEYKKIGVLE